MTEDILGLSLGLIVVLALFLGLPWLIFHYITKWKTAAVITDSDENLLDEMRDLARRLEDRVCTVERILTAENPDWRRECLPDSSRPLLNDDQPRIREIRK